MKVRFYDKISFLESRSLSAQKGQIEDQEAIVAKSLDRSREHYTRKRSWEIDINNKDLPKLHRESNMNNFLYDCEKSESFNINDKQSVEKYLSKADTLIKLMQEIKLEQLSVFREKKNEWYEEWLLRLQAAINNRITTLQNEFIMAANSLLPDGSGDLESGNAWKMARNSFALKKTYSTENIFVEIEIVIKIRQNHISEFKECGLLVDLPMTKQYIVFCFWKLDSINLGKSPSILPVHGLYELRIFDLPKKNVSNLKYTIKSLPYPEQLQLYNDPTSTMPIIIQMILPKKINRIQHQQLSVQIIRKGVWADQGLQDIKLDSNKRIEFKLTQTTQFMLGLVEVQIVNRQFRSVGFPYKNWQIKQDRSEGFQFILKTRLITLQFQVKELVTLQSVSEIEYRHLVGATMKPHELLNVCNFDYFNWQHLMNYGINLLPEESDFEKFECSVFLGTEKVAAWDIAKCAYFFVFRCVNPRINGRIIEAELLEDMHNEFEFLDEKEQKRSIWKKVKWINQKLKLVLPKDEPLNFQEIMSKDNTKEDEFQKKYQSHFQFQSLIYAIDALNYSPQFSSFFSKELNNIIQTKALCISNLVEMIILTKCLYMTVLQQ